MLRGHVYLVGAGPGAADLITARGLRCVEAADVVIFDHAVHARVLRAAPPHAERIDVGSAAPQSVDQQAISYLLAEKAREHKVVVRLKWGDPFVFDQAAVEARFLREQGIPFEVIPGVPAALAAPAYAGIPLTFPGAGDALTLLRGFEDESDADVAIDWGALAKIRGSLVSFAGPRQATTMLQALLTHGRDPHEPAAYVRHGTLPTQDTRVGSLRELADHLLTHPLPGPAVVVVGPVVALRSALRWFDERPLFGRRVLVTRAPEQAGELVELLEMQGAEAVEAALIHIVPPEDYRPLDEACERADAYDWIVFTSANGASAFMDRLQRSGRDARALAGAQLCAVGPGTAVRLARFALLVDLVPDDHSASGVVAALKAAGSLKGKRILFPKGDLARDTLPEELHAAGAEVHEVIAYRTVTAEADTHLGIYRQLLERRIAAVTFSSASAVRAFVSIYGADQAIDLLSHTTVATIGPVTADAALRYGITPQVTPASSTMPALVDALVAHFKRVPVQTL